MSLRKAYHIIFAHFPTIKRFLLVGALAASVNLSVFVLLHDLFFVYYLFASAFANLAAIFCHFFLSRYFTFRSQRAYRKQFPRYCLLVLGNFLLHLSIVWGVVNFHINLLPATF